MLEPLKQFYCDTCGNIIEKPEDGWVEWIGKSIDGKKVNYDFRICHHKRECQIMIEEPYLKDLPLVSFIGEKGIIRMLNFIDIGKTFESDENYSGPFLKNFRQYTEFFRRLTIPYYEEARIHWADAEYDGEHSGQNEVSLYLPDRLKRLVEKYAKD
jgi:NAD-dependent dihydropyrimidine dehydrogenase PreA subunit